MSPAPREDMLTLPGGRTARVWEQGAGEPIVFLGGLLGLPRWPQVLTELARSRRVIAPSLPGFHGCEQFRDLDQTLDWISAVLDLLDACAPEPFDLVGASLGGTLAAEVAALAGSRVRHLVLLAPFGMFRAEEPVTDFWAQRRGALAALCAERTEAFEAFTARPDEVDEVEWAVLTTRSLEATARLLWPIGDTGLARRLHRIHCPTLLLWGDSDRVVPASYAKHFAEAIAGKAQIQSIEAAGHLAEIDQPARVAEAVLRFIH